VIRAHQDAQAKSDDLAEKLKKLIQAFQKLKEEKAKRDDEYMKLDYN
jgi:predicted nuclease with TOPRIM domain